MQVANGAGPWDVFVRGGALGDFILSLPLLKRVSAGERRVCVVTRRAYLDLLAPRCRCDRFIDIDGQAGACLYGASPSPELRGVLRSSQVFLFSRYDAGVAAHLRGVGVGEIRWLDPRPESPPHAAERFLREGGFDAPSGLRRQVLWPRQTSGEALWLHPGSGSATKNWPVGVFAEIAQAWQGAGRGKVIVSFGPADSGLVEPMRAGLRQRGVEAEELHCPPLGGLRDQLSTRAGLFVGNDSGVSHLAAVCGVRTIALFRSTNSAVWRPMGNCAAIPEESDSIPEDWLRPILQKEATS